MTCTHAPVAPVRLGKYTVYASGISHLSERTEIVGSSGFVYGVIRNELASVLETMDIVVPLVNGVHDGGLALLDGHFYSCIASYAIPDYSVPSDFQRWQRFIKQLAAQIRHGKRVIGYCHGGHGRTGMWLASLTTELVPGIADPIAYVREAYCSKAVEVRKQAEYVFRMLGVDLPKEYKDMRPAIEWDMRKVDFSLYPSAS